MQTQNSSVGEFMASSPVFTYEKTSLLTALETMRLFEVENLSVIEDDLSLVGFINKNKILTALNKNIDAPKTTIDKIAKLTEKYDPHVMLYPKMSISDAYLTMKYFHFSGLPVINVPWEKKMIGFLWMDDIRKVMEKNYLKLPV